MEPSQQGYTCILDVYPQRQCQGPRCGPQGMGGHQEGKRLGVGAEGGGGECWKLFVLFRFPDCMLSL